MADQAPTHASRNIEAIIRREEEEARHRPPASRVGEAVSRFAGSLAFLLLHAVLLAGWVTVNLGLVPGIEPFDPYPFGLLGGLFSMEGVLLAAFVLMKQNRMSAREEERAHLDLQVNMLAEQEVTKVIQMLERISTAMGIEHEVMDPEARELGRQTAVGNLAQQLHDRLNPEER